MAANLEQLICDNKRDMGRDPFAGRSRIFEIGETLTHRKYNTGFLEDLEIFTAAAAIEGRLLAARLPRLPKDAKEQAACLNRFKKSLNEFAQTSFGVAIDKPIILKPHLLRIQGGENTAVHSPEDHAILVSRRKTNGMSTEQVLSWVLHETGHEIIGRLRKENPAYLYGKEGTDLAFYENYVNTCSDKEFSYGAYHEAYHRDVEETTVRHMQALFAYEACASPLRAEKIAETVLTHTDSDTGRHFRDAHPFLQQSGGIGKWWAKQFVRM